MAASYGFDISKPATNVKEAIQWLYFGYLAAVKEQNGAAMSLGRTSTFLDMMKGGFAPAESGISMLALVVGFLAAFISGYIACSWMLNLVKKGKLIWFAVYCFVVGIIILFVH